MTHLLVTLAGVAASTGGGAFLFLRAERLDRLPTGGVGDLDHMFKEA